MRKEWEIHFWVFMVLHLLVLIWSIIKYERSPFVQDTSPTRGCDLHRWCLRRDPFDVSWICCEDGQGWPVSHTLAPMALMLITNDFWFSLASDMFWEVIETSELSLGNGMLFADDDAKLANFETNAGQLIADVLECGVPGILLAILLMWATDWRGLAHRHFNADRRAGVFWKYALSGLLALAIWVLPNLSSHRFNYGEIIAVVAQVALILFFWPLVLSPNDVPPGHSNPRAEFRPLIWPWVFVTLVIGAAGPGWLYLYNVFYQVWLSVYSCMLVLLLAVYLYPVIQRRWYVAPIEYDRDEDGDQWRTANSKLIGRNLNDRSHKKTPFN